MSQDPGQKYLNSGASFCYAQTRRLVDGRSGANFTPTIHSDTYPSVDPAKFNLAGKHVLITGASKGVGLTTALSFAAAGASKIALGARSPLASVRDATLAAAKRAGRPPPQVLTLDLDVTLRSSVDAAAAQVAALFDGRLDVLINNAGYLAPFVPLPDSDPDEWWHDYTVNVRGPYLMTRAFWPLLMRSSHKTLVNLTSIGAHILTPHSTAYSPGKMAVLRFNEFVAQDHGVGTPDGVLVYGVHPGGVRTDLALRMPDQLHGFLVDEPALAGDTMVWLVAERREWLAGRYVSVCWDVDELEGKKEEIVKGDLLKMRMAVNSFPS